MPILIWDYKGDLPPGVETHKKYSVFTDTITDSKCIIANGSNVYDLSGFVEVHEFIKREYGISVGDYFYMNEKFFKEYDIAFKINTKYRIDYLRLDLEPYGEYTVEISLFSSDDGDDICETIIFDHIITIEEYRRNIIEEILE